MKASEKIKLSVVMPVYSETDSVKEIVDWLYENVGDFLHEIIIVISPYSSEDSMKVCNRLHDEGRAIVHIQKDNPGVGLAYREGFEYATGSHVLMLDSDGEMSIETVKKMLYEIDSTDCDIVVGSRWIKGGDVRGYGRLKRLQNIAYQRVFRILYWTSVHDLSFGFKIMKKRVTDEIAWNARRQEIGTETTLRPIKMGFSVREVPAVWSMRKQGESKNSFLKNLQYPIMALRILFGG
jgi:dolichol-phosphate mannosyltransferase